MMPHDEAMTQARADIERRRNSLWATMRRYQMSVDSFRAAGQPIPPPPPQLAGRVRVTPDGIADFINPADASIIID